MSNTYEPKIEIESWDEEPIDVVEGAAKVTQASVGKRYSGAIEGTSRTEWLMVYAADETATFVGVERIVATIGGLSGTFVLQYVGRFEDGAATATVTVVAGSATGSLGELSGDGEFRADPEPSISLRLDLGA